MPRENYTFGDNDGASARLRRLADLYEAETRELLALRPTDTPVLAVDLGCGPGWSTRLLQDLLRPERTVGLDASERYVAEARHNHPGLEFMVQDVTLAPFPLPPADALLCRFVLTHVRSPHDVLCAWANAVRSGALLFIHETESLETDLPELRRYYDLVGQLQEYYGQTLMVGGILERAFENTGWSLLENRRLVLEKPAHQMAALHVANLRTWRRDEYAAKVFDPSELDSLESALGDIAAAPPARGRVVRNAARQIVARL